MTWNSRITPPKKSSCASVASTRTSDLRTPAARWSRNVDFFGDGTLFDVTTSVNGNGAKTQGIEASIQAPFTFLPGWMSGFGGLANYTYSEAKDVGLFSQLDGSPLPFPGLSETSYNLVLYYDKGPINARVAWNSRSDWLVPRPTAAAIRCSAPARTTSMRAFSGASRATSSRCSSKARISPIRPHLAYAGDEVPSLGTRLAGTSLLHRRELEADQLVSLSTGVHAKPRRLSRPARLFCLMTASAACFFGASTR